MGTLGHLLLIAVAYGEKNQSDGGIRMDGQEKLLDYETIKAAVAGEKWATEYLCFQVGKDFITGFQQGVKLSAVQRLKIRAVQGILALVDVLAAAGTLADNNTLGLKQLLRVLADLRISGNQAPGHFLNAHHEALRVGLALGNGRQLGFPFRRELGRSQHIRQDTHKVVAVLGGK